MPKTIDTSIAALKYIHAVARKFLAKRENKGIASIANRSDAESKAGEIAAIFQESGLPLNKFDEFIKSENDVVKYLNIIESSKKPQILRDGKTKSIIPKDEYQSYKNDFDKEILGINPKYKADVFDLKGNRIKNTGNIMGGKELPGEINIFSNKYLNDLDKKIIDSDAFGYSQKEWNALSNSSKEKFRKQFDSNYADAMENTQMATLKEVELGKIDLPEIPKPSVVKETEEQILNKLNKGNKKSLSNMRYEKAVKAEEAKAAADEDYIMKVFDPEEFAAGGVAGLLGERPGYGEGNGVADEDAQQKKFSERVIELMDEEGFEFGEAVKEAMKEGYASGGRAGLYQGGQAQIEPNLSDIGHGSDALMARNALLTPGSQATTSTGLNYLLGEDNDTTRVPYKHGDMVLPKPKPEGAMDEYMLKQVLSPSGIITLDPRTREMFIELYKKKIRDKKGTEEKKYQFEELIDQDSQDLYYDKREKELDIKYNPQNYPPSMREFAGGGVAGLLGEGPRSTDHEPRKANGGRIGLAEGDTPSQAWMRDNFYKSGLDRSGVITLHEYMHGPIGKTDYANQGPGKANGGRIGYEEAGAVDKIGGMVNYKNVPYYVNSAAKGAINIAEWMGKLPFAATELASDMIKKPLFKAGDKIPGLPGVGAKFVGGEMFEKFGDSLETGALAEKLGLSSLVEEGGKKVSPEARTVGGLAELGGEFANVGGILAAGKNLLKGGDLLKKLSQSMGKVKDNKTLEKLVDETLTARGEGRRDFNKLVASGGLMVALKSIGLGGIKAAKTKSTPDAVLTLKTVIDDSDVMTENGPVAMGGYGSAIDVSGLTDAVKKSLAVIMKNSRNQLGEKVLKNKVKGKGGKFTDDYEDIPTEEAAYIMEELQKRGHNVKLEHYDDMGGQGVDDLLNKFKNKDKTYGKDNYDKFSKKVAKMTDKEKFEYHSSITDDYGHYYDEFVEELIDMNFKNKTK